MYRQTLTRLPTRGLAIASYRRAFTTTVRAMAEGDTGAPNRLGSLGGPSDAFHKREKANEDYAIRQREKEKLLELRKKLREQQEHLQKLSDHIDELTKDDPESEQKQ
ncbi:mitochondrial ATPase inhibitor, IATP-domain-containing protein [Durotheca rogersii]|uniref:mitochondrial ATPase inhibitor, IATP-domain-containing protein n=1 Tax=Durotheca rogersii TaxID=419775 RepID=UPI00221F3F3A|nr:mitochondrial ATPase inhibitor, IATP-domain-containing protein [Durotheca rogersii]KAI5862093.1 mitochondrial ATPase inhibitor, IATP-domain-containing protein [Durotheca rogersii]